MCCAVRRYLDLWRPPLVSYEQQVALTVHNDLLLEPPALR